MCQPGGPLLNSERNAVGILVGVGLTCLIGLFVIFTSNRDAGWRLLAAAYKNKESSKSIQWRFVSARMGNGSSYVPYRAALNIGSDTHGLHLSMFPLLSIGAPALLIPWEELTANMPEGGSTRDLEFRFRAAPSVFLRINKGLGAAILANKPTYPPVQP